MSCFGHALKGNLHLAFFQVPRCLWPGRFRHLRNVLEVRQALETLYFGLPRLPCLWCTLAVVMVGMHLLFLVAVQQRVVVLLGMRHPPHATVCALCWCGACAGLSDSRGGAALQAT